MLITIDTIYETKKNKHIVTSRSNILSRVSVLSQRTIILFNADAAFNCVMGFFCEGKNSKMKQNVLKLFHQLKTSLNWKVLNVTGWDLLFLGMNHVCVFQKRTFRNEVIF